MAKEESEIPYRPYDTLRKIGLSKDDAVGLLTRIEDAAAQLPPEPEKPPDAQVKYREQKQHRHSHKKRILMVIGAYAIAVWIYVVSMQAIHPDWMYASFATWLPIRMDYVGEGAFVFSFIAIIAALWNRNRALHLSRPETDIPLTSQQD